MKITLQRAHKLASEWKLRAVHILPTLYESQGIQGCSYIFSTGHPLEHINTLLHPPGAKSLTARSRTIVDQANRHGGGFRLDDSYHQRGPGNTGGPKSHSQFSTDMEAAEKIANALMTRGGIRCPGYSAQLPPCDHRADRLYPRQLRCRSTHRPCARRNRREQPAQLCAVPADEHGRRRGAFAQPRQPAAHPVRVSDRFQRPVDAAALVLRRHGVFKRWQNAS